MAPSRKTSNGRSPLVNQQHQITAFFCKKLESSPSPSDSPSPALSKQNPNPKASPSTSRITPPPLQSKHKPVLVISPSLGSSSIEKHCSDNKSYGAEVVDRRIKVYCPLDMSWHEGTVKCFDKISGKHLIQYDDAEEEMLNLLDENIEWIEEPAKKQLRRLRRISLHEDADLKELEDEEVDDLKKLDNEDSLEDLDLEAEKDNFERAGVGKKMSSRKRRVIEGQKRVSVFSKKGKIGGIE